MRPAAGMGPVTRPMETVPMDANGDTTEELARRVSIKSQTRTSEASIIEILINIVKR